MRTISSVLVALPLLVAGCSSSSLQADTVDDASLDQALLGGATDGADLQHVVTIVVDGEDVCTGVAVSENEVVTAAHCVAGLDVTHVRNHTGSWWVNEVAVHPDYAWGQGVDLAIVRVSNGGLYRTLRTPAQLPSEPLAAAYTADGERVRLTGFGRTTLDGRAGRFNSIETDVLPGSSCYGSDGLCLEASVCNQDDGGGIFATVDGQRLLVGVITDGVCGDEPVRSSQLPLFEHYDWLLETLRNETIAWDDHGDTTATATELDLTAGTVIEGLLHDGDVDHFELWVEEAIELDFQAAADAPIRVELDHNWGQGVDLAETTRLDRGRYWLTVEGWWGDEETSYTLTFGEAEPDAPLDVCLDTVDVASTGSTVAWGNTLDGEDVVTPTCGSSIGEDALVEWTAPEAGCFLFDTEGSAFDTVLSHLTSCGEPTVIECNDDDGSANTWSSLIMDVDAGETVLLAVSGYDTAGGDWTLNVTPCE
jgi:hypothetical protein